jgi:type IV pilus assembly protein PilY1
MKASRIVHGILGLALVALAGPSAADDTDIYMNTNSQLPPGSEPIIMFSLDYRPNLAAIVCQNGECDGLVQEGYLQQADSYTFFDLLRAAMAKVFRPLTNVKVGLMLNHNNEDECVGPDATTCSNGGYIAMGAALFTSTETDPDTGAFLDPAKAEFENTLRDIPLPLGNQSHSYQGKELFFELYRYLTGQGLYNAHDGWTDYGTDNKFNLNHTLDNGGPAWDASIESGADYLSPLAAASQCTKAYTVNIMFEVSNQEDASDAAIAEPVGNGGFGGVPKDFPSVINYLNATDLADGTVGTVPDLEGLQNVTSYFLVPPEKINTKTIGYARAGGTGAPLALTDDPEELIASLQEIFKEILSVSTTVVAASVPVNVFNRAELLGSVYIALFQLDPDDRPAWFGNVKKLHLDTIGDTSLLVDATGQAAIDGVDGRLRYNALTFWTDPAALPPADPDLNEVTGRDGRTVPRGGAGQQIPGFLSSGPGLTNGPGGRTLYYDGVGTLLDFNANDITATKLQYSLGAASSTEAKELIEFARGLDVDDLDGDRDKSEARRWIFSDPLHSQPLVLNYGARDGYSLTNPEVFLAVGSNDGYLRFIRDKTTGGAESGQEVWGFIPSSTMKVQKTLRSNGVTTPHPYAVDGTPTAYVGDSNHNGTIDAGEHVYLYFGLRRGGKAYYALDVSDPLNPQLLWFKDKTADFGELGYTFSTPRVGLVDLGNGAQPVLVFGGGYDTNKDAHTLGTDDSEGNAIYVVDAVTGALIWKAVGPGGASPSSSVFVHNDLVDSIPSTVTAADTDGDGLLDRILVGDTGGNVWRADLAGQDTSNWQLTRIAVLGRHATGDKTNDRRFFHRPDLVPSHDADGPFDAVLIGSGDRANPLGFNGDASNYFYMIKDRHVSVGSGTDLNLTPADLADVTDDCVQVSNCTPDLTNGWKLQLEDQGEKSLSTPITIGGQVFFTTYIPAASTESSSCAPSEGSGRLYAVSLQDARAVMNYDAPLDETSNVATTKSDRSTELHAPGIPAEVVSVPPNQILRPDLQIDQVDVTTRWRTFWYKQEDADL